MSTNPVHLKGKYGQLFPSSLIPYCSFATDMLDLGEKMDNFTYPICTAFKPILHNGQNCYELDTDRIKKSLMPVKNGGLVMLLDIGKERSVTVRKNREQALGKPKSNNELVLGKDLYGDAMSSGLVYVHTLEPYTFQIRNDTNLILTSLKAMTGTENFLALPDSKKDCSVETFERCKIQQFVNKLDNECNCVPYGHEIIRGNRTLQVTRICHMCAIQDLYLFNPVKTNQTIKYLWSKPN